MLRCRTAPSHYFCGQGRDRTADLPLVRQPASIGGAKARNSWTCWTCSRGRTATITVSLKSAPRGARHGSTPRASHRDSNLSLPPAAEPLRASQRDLAACRQLPRAAREQSAPPTERTSASTGIGTQPRPGPAILAGPLRLRTGTAAKTAAAQVGKRCQLSNGTRHG